MKLNNRYKFSHRVKYKEKRECHDYTYGIFSVILTEEILLLYHFHFLIKMSNYLNRFNNFVNLLFFL